MKVVVLQSNYFPWKGYFELIHNADVFCFYDEVQYTKNDWRNRNQIIGPNGLFWLTIPISKDAVKKNISQVKFGNLDWVDKHLMSIKQAYSKAPNRDSVLNLIEPVLLNAKDLSLSLLNQKLIIAISDYVGIKTEFQNSSQYKLEIGKTERLIKLVKDIGGSKYISGPAAKDYLSNSSSLFERSGVELSYIEYGPYKEYPQKTVNCNDYVSILDLLMNIGKDEALNYIISIK